MLSNETKGLDILNKKSYCRIINAVNKYEQDKSERQWDVIERDLSDNTIVRHLKNLSTIEAEDAYYQIVNSNPVRSNYHTVKMIENKGDRIKIEKKSGNESGNLANLESGIPVKNANNLKICW